MNFAGMSIQRRLRLIIMMTTTVALLLAGGASVVVDFVSLGQITERDMNTLASVVSIDSTAPLTFRDRDAAREILTSLRAKPAVIEAAIFDRSGLPFVTYARQGSFAPGSLRDLRESPQSGHIEVFNDIIFDGEEIGTLYIAASRDIVKMRLRQYVLILGGILVVALVVTFILSSKLPEVVSRPIAGLAGVAREITRGDNHGLRADEPRNSTPSEIRDLITAFNQMLGEIDRHRNKLEIQVQERTAELSIVLDRNQAILDSAGEGIFGLDLDGIVTFMNPSAASILGSAGMGLVGRSLHAHIHAATCPDRTLPHDDCRVCGARLAPSVRIGRGKFNRFDGGAVPIEYTSSTIVDDRGKPAGVVVTFRDISERLAMEKMKDEFVSTVSHELRTPLTSIRGALGLLGSGLLGNVDQRAQRMLDIAVSNTDRLVRLINDILDLERIDSGRVDLNRGMVDSGDLMIEATEGIQDFAERAGVTVIADPSHLSLWADHDRIIQTLTNLLSNAVKFSPSGTTILLNGSARDGMYTFAIEDEGRGIPKEHLETIFERFQQVDASDSREKGGTGLGLAICRSIVAAHGGRIWAESEEGKGTTFCFTIPLYEIPADSPDERPVDAAYDRPAVLIVEDDNDLARVIGASLQANGLRTRHVTSGRCALAACKDEVPDVVILDLILPEMDGFEVVQWMRTQARLAHVPLVVYTAHEVSPSDQERLRLGPTEFMTKSRVSPEEFQHRVVELLAAMIAAEEVQGAA
ncbi:MAG TPA: ATP-binding protein [Thermoanaerobaculia bacterium]|nr:ATP-binding protein [Thermoanaerobaculia bacterium]